METLILTTIPWLICQIIAMLIILAIAAFAMFGLLLIIPHKDKPAESLFTEEQKKQLDLLVNIALNLSQITHIVPTEYVKAISPQSLQIADSILDQAECIAGLTGRCFIMSKVRAILILNDYNNPTKDDSK